MEMDTLAALKFQLEQVQQQVSSIQQIDGSDVLLSSMQQFAEVLNARIASLEPPPKEVPIHAQSQKLQWKVNKKTKQVSDLKEKIVAARRHLKGLQSRYQKASEVLVQLRAQWQLIGPALIEPPSPLKSETEQTDAEESQSGPEDPDGHATAYSEDQNEWQQPKWRSSRKRRMTQVPCVQDVHPAGSHSSGSMMD